MIAYVPKLYTLLGWPYKARPTSPYEARPTSPYEAPSGTVTVAGPGQTVPCGADKEVMLYLCNLARSTMPGSHLIGSFRELSVWLLPPGKKRRKHRMMERLRRVVACTV